MPDDPNAAYLEAPGLGSDLVADLAGPVLGAGIADRSLSRPLFVAGDEIDDFHRDFDTVLDVVGRLPEVLGLGLRGYAELVGMPAVVVRLLDDGPVPPPPRYGRADLFHDGTGFRILELGTSPAVGGVTRAAVLPRLLRAEPAFARLVEGMPLRDLDPMRGVDDLLRAAGALPGVVLVEATGALAEWAHGWSSFVEGLGAWGWEPRLVELGDVGDARGAWRLFMLGELAGEPDPAESWACIGRLADAVPWVTPPECDVANSKACLALLRDPRVTGSLTAAQRAAIERVVPPTWFPADVAELVREQRTTILKPAVGARGEGTVAGWAVPAQLWRSAAEEAVATGGYVAQRRVRARTETAVDRTTGRPAPFRAVWGMHYGPAGLTGMAARVTAESGPAVVNVGTPEVLLAPVLVHDALPADVLP